MRKQFRIAIFLICFLCAHLPSALAAAIKVDSTPEMPCLSIIPGATNQLVYPEDALQRKDGGNVEVDMIFTGPDSAPDTTIQERYLATSLVDAVRDYVRRYRLPCMKSGDAPLKLHQVYHFNSAEVRPVMHPLYADDRTPPPDPSLQCMVNINGDSHAEIPRDFEVQRDINRVGLAKYYYKLTFTAPDQPPQLEWIAASPITALQRSIKYYVRGLRLPCMTGTSVTFEQSYMFGMDKGARTFLKDMTLRQFVGRASEYPKNVSFDLTTMDCPFDLRVTYRQPYKRNAVLEYDKSVPNRAAFVEWLANIRLQFDETDSLTVFLNTFTLTIPCGTVKL